MKNFLDKYDLKSQFGHLKTHDNSGEPKTHENLTGHKVIDISNIQQLSVKNSCEILNDKSDKVCPNALTILIHNPDKESNIAMFEISIKSNSSNSAIINLSKAFYSRDFKLSEEIKRTDGYVTPEILEKFTQFSKPFYQNNGYVELTTPEGSKIPTELSLLTDFSKKEHSIKITGYELGYKDEKNILEVGDSTLKENLEDFFKTHSHLLSKDQNLLEAIKLTVEEFINIVLKEDLLKKTATDQAFELDHLGKTIKIAAKRLKGTKEEIEITLPRQ